MINRSYIIPLSDIVFNLHFDEFAHMILSISCNNLFIKYKIKMLMVLNRKNKPQFLSLFFAIYGQNHGR